MTLIDLPDVTEFDAKRLAAARRQLRSAALWPARVAASYAPADRQPQLIWCSKRNAIVTCDLENGLQLELRPAELSMQFLEHGKPVPHVLDMDDRSPAHVEAWLLVELLHRGIDRERFSKALPFDLGDLMSGDHEKFVTLDYPAELAALSQWLSAAGTVLSSIAASDAVAVGVPDVTLSVPASPDAAKPERLVTFSLGDTGANPEPHFAIVRPTIGTVTPLRPEAVMTVSQLRRDQLGPDAIAKRLREAAAIGAS